MPLADRIGAFLWNLYKTKKITKAEYKKGMAEAANTSDTPAITKLLKKKKDKLKADENKGEPYKVEKKSTDSNPSDNYIDKDNKGPILDSNHKILQHADGRKVRGLTLKQKRLVDKELQRRRKIDQANNPNSDVNTKNEDTAVRSSGGAGKGGQKLSKKNKSLLAGQKVDIKSEQDMIQKMKDLDKE